MSKTETTAVLTCIDDLEISCTIRLYPGHPAVHYLKGGDPGYPAEDDEVEIYDCAIGGEPFEPTGDQHEKMCDYVLENIGDFFSE